MHRNGKGERHLSQVSSKTALRVNSSQAFDVEQRGKLASQRSQAAAGRRAGRRGQGGRRRMQPACTCLSLESCSCPHGGELSLLPKRPRSTRKGLGTIKREAEKNRAEKGRGEGDPRCHRELPPAPAKPGQRGRAPPRGDQRDGRWQHAGAHSFIYSFNLQSGGQHFG